MDAINIGGRQVSMRRALGVVGLVAGSILAAVLVVGGHGFLLRLTTFPLFLFGALGLLQARERTWVNLAARGTRDLGSGPEPIEDAGTLAALRAKARGIMGRSFLLAAILTAVACLWPGL